MIVHLRVRSIVAARLLRAPRARWLLTAILATLLCSRASAAEFYVAVDGDDQRAGTGVASARETAGLEITC